MLLGQYTALCLVLSDNFPDEVLHTVKKDRCIRNTWRVPESPVG